MSMDQRRSATTAFTPVISQKTVTPPTSNTALFQQETRSEFFNNVANSMMATMTIAAAPNVALAVGADDRKVDSLDIDNFLRTGKID